MELYLKSNLRSRESIFLFVQSANCPCLCHALQAGRKSIETRHAPTQRDLHNRSRLHIIWLMTDRCWPTWIKKLLILSKLVFVPTIVIWRCWCDDSSHVHSPLHQAQGGCSPLPSRCRQWKEFYQFKLLSVPNCTICWLARAYFDDVCYVLQMKYKLRPQQLAWGTLNW